MNYLVAVVQDQFLSGKPICGNICRLFNVVVAVELTLALTLKR